jgi:DNA adenine methylase
MKANSPLPWFGEKEHLTKEVLDLLPTNHKKYIEPFFSNDSVFFTKSSCDFEVINDLNGEVVNFYKVVQKDYHKLGEEIRNFPFSRRSFQDARIIKNNPHLFNELQRASATYILANQSLGLSISNPSKHENFAKSYFKKTDELFSGIEIQKRLTGTIIEQINPLEMFLNYDNHDVVFYVHPPYINSKGNNANEFNWSSYMKLLSILSGLEGKFILSSYRTDQLEKAILKNRWNSKIVKRPPHSKNPENHDLIVTNFEQTSAEVGELFNEDKL